MAGLSPGHFLLQWRGRAFLLRFAVAARGRRLDDDRLAGGDAGQIGQNSVRRNDGRIDALEGADATVIDAGEAVIIQTPTAGGYGKPK